MLGSPILRAALVFFAMLALAPLMAQLTKSVQGRPEPPAQAEAKNPSLDFRLSFSTQATSASIQHLGRDIWSKQMPGTAEEFSAALPWPREGIELRVVATFPDSAANAAIRVRVTDPDGTEHDRSAWGAPVTDDVLKFP